MQPLHPEGTFFNCSFHEFMSAKPSELRDGMFIMSGKFTTEHGVVFVSNAAVLGTISMLKSAESFFRLAAWTVIVRHHKHNGQTMVAAAAHIDKTADLVEDR